MSIRTLRIQFDQSFWNVLKDLVKLEALDEHRLAPGEVLHDLEEHASAHKAMLIEVARLTSPAKTRPLPFVRV